MGLNVALQDAMTGLRATQTQIQVISANIANAQTPGYSEESVSQTPIRMPTGAAGVQTGIVQRASDQLLTTSLAKQSSAASSASTTDNYLQQLQGLLGQVGSGSSFTDAYNNFVAAMQTESATPEDPVAQSAAVNAGQQLAQQLNQFSAGIQGLRSNADSDLGSAATNLNTALGQIAALNGSIVQLQADGTIDREPAGSARSGAQSGRATHRRQLLYAARRLDGGAGLLGPVIDRRHHRLEPSATRPRALSRPDRCSPI